MRISADGFMNISDNTFVRFPGDHDETVEPLPEKDALAFLLSHSFPGQRTITRRLSESGCRALRKARWAESVSERMAHVDRVWRSITEPVQLSELGMSESQLVQIVLYGEEWAYPVYVSGDTTYVLPAGGVPVGELKRRRGTPRIDLQSA